MNANELSRKLTTQRVLNAKRIIECDELIDKCKDNIVKFNEILVGLNKMMQEMIDLQEEF